MKAMLARLLPETVAQAREQPDTKLVVVLLLAPFCLAMIRYLDASHLLWLLRHTGHAGLAAQLLADPATWQLISLACWALTTVVFYFALPALAIKLVFRERLADYGLRPSSSRREFLLYLIMLSVMVPLVLLASGTGAFAAIYPFYRLQPGEGIYPRLLIWWPLYFLQFAALEFFFRGFLVHGLKHRFGIYSVLVMTVPYCMIHFAKPWPETIGAIIAGLVLGAVSLESRSIFLGIAAHISVALSLDLTVLWRTGHFG